MRPCGALLALVAAGSEHARLLPAARPDDQVSVAVDETINVACSGTPAAGTAAARRQDG